METRISKKIVALLTLLLTGIITINPVFAADTQATITFKSVLKDDLSDEQQKQIQSGNPTGIVNGDDTIILVYEKDGSCVIVPPTTPNVPPVTPPTTPSVPPVTPPVNPPTTPIVPPVTPKGTLPHTGTISDMSLLFIGTGLLVLTGFMIKKYKFSAVALIILAGATIMPVVSTSADDAPFGKTISVQYTKGETISYQPEAIACYRYVGYIRNVKKGSVIAEYVDENGTKLQNDVPVLTDAPIDTKYVANKPATIEANGKTYYLFKVADNETGLVVEGTTVVTYVYKLKGNYVADIKVNVINEGPVHPTGNPLPFKELVVYYKNEKIATLSGTEFGKLAAGHNQTMTGHFLPTLAAGETVHSSDAIINTAPGINITDAITFYTHASISTKLFTNANGFIGDAITERPSIADFSIEIDGVKRDDMKLSDVANIQWRRGYGTDNTPDASKEATRLYTTTYEDMTWQSVIDPASTYHADTVSDSFILTIKSQPADSSSPMGGRPQ